MIKTLRRQEARSAAPNKNRMDSTTPYIGKLGLEIGQKRFDIAALVKSAVLDLMRIKVAIGALALTPWEVDIE
jgi:hypothetical protein